MKCEDNLNLNQIRALRVKKVLPAPLMDFFKTKNFVIITKLVKIDI